MPSTCPVPNFSGSLENFFAIAYDIQAAMSAPEPGWMPITVPSALPLTSGHGYFFSSAHIPLNMLPIFSAAIFGGGAVSTM